MKTNTGGASESAVVRIPKSINDKLDVLSHKTGRTKIFYITEALTRYMEDMEDFVLAEAATEKTKRRISYNDLAKELGLES